MANPARGEVAFRVADEDYVLKFTTNAICKVEKELEEGLNSILQNMQRVTTVRALLWAGQQRATPQTHKPRRAHRLGQSPPEMDGERPRSRALLGADNA